MQKQEVVITNLKEIEEAMRGSFGCLFEVTLNTPESGKPDMALFLNASDEETAGAAALEVMRRPVDAGYVVTGAKKIQFAMVADIHDRMYEPIVA